MVRPKRANIVQAVEWWGGGGWAQTCPHYTNHYKILRLPGAIFSLVFKKLLSILATLLIQGRSLQ